MQKIILLVLILALSACSAPAPAGTSTTTPIPSPTHTVTVTFTETPEPTPTPEPPTATPEVSYNCPGNPDAPNMTRVSLAEDIQSGKLAKWVLEENKDLVINPNYADLVFRFSIMPSDKSGNFSASDKDKPGWVAKYASVIGMCKINPSEWGLEGKDDLALFISVLTDSQGTRAAQFTFTTMEEARGLAAHAWFTDPINMVAAIDSAGSYATPYLVSPGAVTGSPGDFRQLGDEEIFFGVQNKTFEAVRETFQGIGETGIFSEYAQNMLNTTVFYQGEAHAHGL